MLNKYKNLGINLTGTAASYFLPFIALPFLSRFYTPSDFGNLAMVQTYGGLFAMFITGRSELLILSSECPKQSNDIINFGLSITAYLLAFVMVLSFIIDMPIVFYVAIFAVATAIYNLSTEIYGKHKRFLDVSLNKLVLIGLNPAVKLLGYLFGGSILQGETLSKFITLLYSLRFLNLKKVNLHPRNTLKIIQGIKNDIKYILPEQLLNNLSGTIHVVILAGFVSKADLGYLTMSLSLLAIPVMVIAGGIKDVLRQDFKTAYFSGKRAKNLVRPYLFKVGILAVISIILGWIILPILVNLFLGDQWTDTVYIMRCLIPASFMNICASILGDWLLVASQLKVLLLYQIFNVFLTSFAIVIPVILKLDFGLIILFYAIARFLVYFMYSLLVYFKA